MILPSYTGNYYDVFTFYTCLEFQNIGSDSKNVHAIVNQNFML